ncbi:MAG TPA: dihydrofolate reductase family protein [Pyrinomonadaceae bacterium]|nr:dihydrofolate reductase family protein [Pyrinomonadaceae bacterium]
MSKIVLDITMSIDGFVSGPNVSDSLPLGENGLRLHDWIFSQKTDADEKILNDLVGDTGAVIVGRRTFDTAIENAWEGKSPFDASAIVISNREPNRGIEGFAFVRTINDAVEKASAAAGEKNIWLMGGANTIQGFIREGLVDEMNLHIAHITLGNGTRLFDGDRFAEFKQKSVAESKAVTHLRFKPK